jgi:hypothetical protein
MFRVLSLSGVVLLFGVSPVLADDASATGSIKNGDTAVVSLGKTTGEEFMALTVTARGNQLVFIPCRVASNETTSVPPAVVCGSRRPRAPSSDQ